MNWYLVYRCRWVGEDLVRDRDPLDGVRASHQDAAVRIASARNDWIGDDLLKQAGPAALHAVCCVTAPQRVLASDLDGRHEVTWMSVKEFADWMRQPAYRCS